MTGFTDTVNALLEARARQSTKRQLDASIDLGDGRIEIAGKTLINFASNDYLGLSHHPLLKESAIKAIQKYGIGNASSRYISGNCELYEEIEQRLAILKGTDKALIFPSGFQTNFSVLYALSKLNSFFLCDELSHNSILLGAQLNGRYFRRFAHNSLEDVQNYLNKKGERNNWLITESVFSMDGDIAPLEDLGKIVQQNNAYLYVDEAHATGVMGKNGMGLMSNPDERTIVMGTFGKGLGSFGAYVACSNLMQEYLINFCPGLIYTTALPPSILSSIMTALELIPGMTKEREYLNGISVYLKAELDKLGFNTGSSHSQIICLYMKDTDIALLLSQYLEENGIYARAIRPPTVPDARIRLSLSAAHKESDIEFLLQVLKVWHEKQY